MIGEIIVCNVAGWFTIATDRFWPREKYIPNFEIRLLGAGETITIEGGDHHVTV